jgi:ectoine hydroxylase
MVDHYPSRQGQDTQILPRQEPVIYSDITPESALTADQADQFEANGFLVVPSLFQAEEVAEYVAELDRIRADKVLLAKDEAITERSSGELRSLFQVHQSHDLFASVAKDPRIANIARCILGGDVYIHQSRLNFKPGLHGKEFFWHSDFETWHVEDGMPKMRAISCSVLLTDNTPENGALMLMPGTHKHFLPCIGRTPADHYKASLKQQEYGIPDDASLTKLGSQFGIVSAAAKAGSVVFFDCNTLHGSNSNITPDPRSNLFFVYNHIDNLIGKPFCEQPPRPEFIASRKRIQRVI